MIVLKNITLQYKIIHHNYINPYYTNIYKYIFKIISYNDF